MSNAAGQACFDNTQALLKVCPVLKLRLLLVQANKSAVIQGPEKHYPPVTAQEFVKESLAAIYLSQEGQQGDNAAIIKAAKHPENAVLNAVD